MKLKYYLRGVGIGIIVATLILTIAFAYHKNHLPEDFIIKQAQELGMVMADEDAKQNEKDESVESDDQKDMTLADLQAKKEEAESQVSNNEENKQEENSRTDKIDQTKETLSTGTDEPNEQSEQSEQTKPTIEVVSEIEITIVPGEYSDVISEKLKKAGLIQDADAFNQYLADKNKDKDLQPGRFVIRQGASYDEIIDILCEKQ